MVTTIDDPNVVAILESDVVGIQALYEADFLGGVLRISTASVGITDSAGNYWSPTNGAISAEGLSVQGGLFAENRKFKVEGPYNSDMSIEKLLLDSEAGYKGRDIREYLLFFSYDASVVLPDPVLIWSGKMDLVTYTVSETSIEIELSCEGVFAERNHTPDCMLTWVDQNKRHPGDDSLSDVATLEIGQAITWPN